MDSSKSLLLPFSIPVSSQGTTAKQLPQAPRHVHSTSSYIFNFAHHVYSHTMGLTLFMVLALWPLLTPAFGLRASRTASPPIVNGEPLTFPTFSKSTEDVVDWTPSGLDKDFDPAELLESRKRTPEIYAKAMVELKRLEEEPLCHRTATQLLLNNCQGLQDISQADYQLHSSRMQRHHVESLAATLAICDMERRFVIPDACTAFRMPALLEAAEAGKVTLNVSSAEVGGCLEALGRDHSHWNTWLSYRDTALLLCQASRLDIEKGV